MEIEYQDLPSIINELCDKYNLKESRTSKQAIRDKIIRICESITVKLGDEKTNLLDIINRPELKQGNAVYYFNKDEKRCLIESDDLRKYLYKQCAVQKIGTPFTRAFVRDYENEEKDNADAELSNQRYEYLAGTDEFDSYEGTDVSLIELKQKKSEIMLEALFLKFFEPVDEELLKRDMRARNKGGGNENTKEAIAAYERLKDNSNYYNKRDDEKLMDKLVDKLMKELNKRNRF